MKKQRQDFIGDIDTVTLVRQAIAKEGRRSERGWMGLMITTFTVLSFFALSFYVMIITRTMGDFHVMNLLFTLFWSLIAVGGLCLLPLTARRITYCTVYTILLIYGFGQYIYYGFFGKLISFASFANAGEGAGYAGAIFEKIGFWQTVFFLALAGVGITLTVFANRLPSPKGWARAQVGALMLCGFITLQFALPMGLGGKRKSFTWTPGGDHRYVYDNYLDKQACLGMAGLYQYLSLDTYNCFIKPLFANTEEQRAAVDGFFEKYKPPHKQNEMTGLFEGKNVVLIMLESMDYLAIHDAQNTPTIHYMMENGINFTNYYAPLYGDGATFSNEFTLNTGIITPTDGKTLYNYQNNGYSKSLAKLFEEKGYSANSFHENGGGFYNREEMHNSFGYDKYHSYYEYGGDTKEVEIDTYLTRTPELMKDFLGDGDKPFFNFLITYSAHLSYYYTERLTSYAYDTYVPDGELRDGPQDLNCLRAKARITDQMLRELIDACPDDTVFICATDHYCYGLSEHTREKYLGEDENLRQRVPFFIYSKAEDIEPMQVDTPCANVDVLPTVANLMGLGLPEYTLGNDIFDPDYEGYVIFSDFALLTEQAYYKDGEIIEAFTDTVNIDKLNDLLSYAYARAEASNNILAGNYYKEK